jgi:hypothetical protein
MSTPKKPNSKPTHKPGLGNIALENIRVLMPVSTGTPMPKVKPPAQIQTKPPKKGEGQN